MQEENIWVYSVLYTYSGPVVCIETLDEFIKFKKLFNIPDEDIKILAEGYDLETVKQKGDFIYAQ